ncbi:MAG TPA: glycosyltransferase family 87 protein [Gemmataceae bacterium]|nr:glycosyltransferase family 87 protein [Gemmataceae bacterium]
MSHFPPSGSAPLTSWQRRGLVLVGAAVVLFGAVVEFRSALLAHRAGDLGVFLRAAWAVRSGEDLYAITDNNGHHYHYPPLLAILLAPLADPPPGRTIDWALGYRASVAAWYVVSVACLVLALHWLASALEESLYGPGDRPRRGGRAWWALRAVPLVGCLPAVGGALMRGQVDFLLLLLLCGMTAAALRGQSVRAGILLAAAISVKVFPAFLLLYPLWRRDRRWLVGCAAGLVLFLGVLPAAALGPARAAAYAREWYEVLLKPGLTDGGDQARAAELTNITGTDSQSFVATIHNTRHLERATRPPAADRAERLAHWAIGALLTLATWLAGRRAPPDGPAPAVLLGALTVLMLLLSPVCHLHYFSLSVPLVLGLTAAWQARGGVGRGLVLLLAVNVAANALPRLPGLEVLRDVGLAGYAALLLWAVACAVVWRSTRRPGAAVSHDLPRRRRMAA